MTSSEAVTTLPTGLFDRLDGLSWQEARGETGGTGNTTGVKDYNRRPSPLSQRRMERGLTLGEVALALRTPVAWVLQAERDRQRWRHLRSREAQLLIRARWPT